MRVFRGAMFSIGICLLLIGSYQVLAQNPYSFACSFPYTFTGCLQEFVTSLDAYTTGTTGQDIPCTLVLSTFLTIVPPYPLSLANLLTIGSQQCSLSSCGVDQGQGYWNIYCNTQCQLALYGEGQCRNNVTEGANYASCLCYGRRYPLLGPDPNLQTVYLMCQIFGNCACTTCLSGSSSSNWKKGECIQQDNGVLDKCSNPPPPPP